MITSYYSFKVLVHDVKLQITEPIILQKARLSVILANFPKLYIAANRAISSLTPEVKCFNHGKQVQLQINHEQLKEILINHPLEIILINNTKFLAGSKIKLTSFLPDIEKSRDFRFRRGTFHLLDPTGQPFALADVSLCLHAIEEKHEHEDDGQNRTEMKVQRKAQSGQYEPPPEDIVYRGQNESGPKQNDARRADNENRQQEQLLTFGFKNQLNISAQEQEQSNILPQSLDCTQPQKKSNKRREKEKEGGAGQQSVSILEWVNGYHCPPPMILDKKVQQLEQPRQVVNHFGKLVQQESVAVQTENDGLALHSPQPVYLKFSKKPSFESQNRSVADKNQQENKDPRIKTGQSEEYYNDEFESFDQSQQVSKPRKQSADNKLSESNLKKSFSVVIGEEDQDKASEIYSEDFENMSQSQSISMKKSHSLERIGKKKHNIEEISESYIPDFESVSQSQSISQLNSYSRQKPKR